MGTPRVVSVNVGPLAPLRTNEGAVVPSGIVKRPVPGRVEIGPLGPVGDAHGDPRHHGGPRKAVYAYPVEHYEFWRRERPEMELPPGVFGENLTLEGILEDSVRPGDSLAIGTAVLEVTEPRSPCRRLAARFHRPTFVTEFQASGRSGFYLSVERSGTIGAGDPIGRRPGASDGPTIAALFRATG